ncbi:phosphatidylglycerophosphatase A family protein [Volucribacter amazonae]|uniref:Phosphatidylglycerophosphatase A n=1 Tax=Volucribacter amazonae TaxID=256731 RepID=A0A9X4PA11_9PAST|nr:phosphatidylglycerophosphatase A [Volucribacter amazonae]MDG6894377.1 phosphatidylglycerophosphatase [Volucribacter amazonae]
MRKKLIGLNLTNPIHFCAVGFGSGLLSPAPGTWGSLAGLFIGGGLLSVLSAQGFLLFTLLSFVLGCYFCGKTAKDMGVHDHGSIVWDEFVGIFLVLLAIPSLTWGWCIIAFLLFRFFDILKPYPIRYFDQKLHNGFGIMIDDVLAAGYSILLIVLYRILG